MHFYRPCVALALGLCLVQAGCFSFPEYAESAPAHDASAGGGGQVDAVLRAYGRPLGEAFQLRDDLHDDDAARGIGRDDVLRLVAQARAALLDAPIAPAPVAALEELADLVAAA